MKRELSAGPKRRVFERPEHEWLRIAAMVEPDWEELRRLPQEARPGEPEFDWPLVIDERDRQQLLGIAMWRLLAAELDGVRPAASDYLADVHAWQDELDSDVRDDWMRAARAHLRVLEAAGIPYVFPGSLPVYALYHGFSHWPRHFDDVDVCVPSALYERAKAALTEAAGHLHGNPHSPTLQRDGDAPTGAGAGTPIALEVATYPPAYDYMPDGFYGDPVMFEGRQEMRLCGFPLPVPRREAWLCLHAARSYGQFEWYGAPITVGHLSRLHNIATSGPFDWQAVAAILRHFWQRNEARLAAGASLPWLPPEESPEVVRRCCVSYSMAWMLQLADAAYAFVPASFWQEVGRFLDLAAPLLVLALPATLNADHGPAPPEFAEYVECGPLPPIEEFVFDWWDISCHGPDHNGYAARVAAGLWRPTGVRRRIGQEHWAIANVMPLIPRGAG